MVDLNDLLKYPTNVPRKDKQGSNRFGTESNIRYAIPQSAFVNLKGGSKAFTTLVQYYTTQHYQNELERIIELQRYYFGDNNIHYWKSTIKTDKQSDNKISNPWATYITNLRVGHQFGNPIQYGYENTSDEKDNGESLLEEVDAFNNGNNESYHNRIMAINMFTTGVAYELLYIADGTNQPKLTAINPNTCFVVWSTDIDPVELFAVRYYEISVAGNSSYNVEVYTDDSIYYYDAGNDIGGDWTLTKVEPHYIGSVPITEFNNNPERMGCYERVLDKIDEFDESESQMANNQQDFSNAQLMISGEVTNSHGKPEALTDKHGNQIYLDKNGLQTIKSVDDDGNKNAPLMQSKVLNTHANVLYLKPTRISNPSGQDQVIPTTASYLTKELNVADWDKHRQDIANEIMLFTNTPNVLDQNFANNASGVAMAYKLFGMDQETALTTALYTNGIHRRLQLLANYLGLQPDSAVSADSDTDNPANVTITFTPNNPKNGQEIVANIQSLNATGAISHETIQDMASQITGVPQSQEQQRMDDQQQANSDRINKANANVFGNNLKGGDGVGGADD
ncbi:phage portal protein [Fructilactobacillus florum]|uniref:Phage portal protein, SPP1 family n=1 Tax=Fructilactobacillus florum DSM 22689 = JCM 16035 TaxID=1423745 RepID=A0A0R2CJQ8_9LACO|nr:phage portal protein [Fructilactobacillus florum]KRM91589.1 phage portal protein, SPP1 family [Fructilactobacillus florum DSM 22689 = JCM 16035]